MITIYDWFGYDLKVEERYKMIKEAGFDGVLLWWSEYLDRNDYRSGPKMVREAGLYIENIHTPFQVQDYIWLDNLDGESSLKCYLQCVLDCAEFEIPTMVIHLPDDDKPYNEIGLNRIKNIAEKAEQLNVNVALENLHNLTNLSYILEQVDSPRIGFCYDCCHHLRYYPNYDFLTKYSPRLMALHLHDYSENSIHRLPFDNTINWANTMSSIASTNYKGNIAIEAMNWAYKDISATQFLYKAYEGAKRLEDLFIRANPTK